MIDFIWLIPGIVVSASGILILIRPRWFRSLWKIRTTYEYWGNKIASRYYSVLGILIIAIGLWMIIKSLKPLIR